MAKFINMTGMKVGRLLITEEYEMRKGRAYWKCICECGTEKFIMGKHLKSGATVSCGCMQKEKVTTHGLNNHPLYMTASGILERCNNETSISYKNYGGRGIECKIGSTVIEVLNALIGIPGWFSGAQIDRIDNDGHYELGNLRWVTKSENCLNRSASRPAEYYETNCVQRATFKSSCKNKGWNFDDFEEIDSKRRNKWGAKWFFYKTKTK